MEIVMANVQMLPLFMDSFVKAGFPSKDQRRVNSAFSQLMKDPSHPSLSLERLRKTKDRNFWSARVTGGIRMVLYRKNASYILCFVGSHDNAYRWAENKSVGVTTEGAIEIIEDDKSPIYELRPADGTGEHDGAAAADELDGGETDTSKDFVFRNFSDAQLLSFGVPEYGLSIIRDIGTPEDLLDVALPWGDDIVYENLEMCFLGDDPLALSNREDIKRAAESVFGKRKIYPIVDLEDTAALQSAMKQPWEKWLIFADSTQKDIINQKHSGPAKIYGSAGTGKTVVALHRAGRLARQPGIKDNKILLLTFSKTLANDLKEKLDLLIGNSGSIRSKVNITDFLTYALSKYGEFNPGNPAKAAEDVLTKRAAEFAVRDLGLISPITPEFLYVEYLAVIESWGLRTLDEYLGFPRTGRGEAMSPVQRKTLWPAVEYIRRYVRKRGRIPKSEIYHSVSEQLEKAPEKPADHVIVDECQDIGPEVLRMIRAMVTEKDDDIFLCGDLGQSLYRRNHSWIKHGIDIRGRSRVLRINYRTSRQIKETADRLTDLHREGPDRITEDRRAISRFDGPQPVIRLYGDEDGEIRGLSEWISEQISDGVKPHEIVIISRTDDYFMRASSAAAHAGLRIWRLDADNNWHANQIGFSSTERSKGLEYRAVAVIACDNDAMPYSRYIENSPGEVEKFERTMIEKNHLYVAMTRARDSLYISGLKPGSVFLKELTAGEDKL